MGRLRGMRAAWQGFRQTIMYQLLTRQKRYLWWLLASAMVSLTAAIGTADTLRKLVDHGVVAQDKPIKDYIDLLVLLAFMGFVGGLVLRQVLARLTYHLEFELRVWLYERLQSTDPTRLDSLSTGQMVTRAMTDLLLLELVVLVVPAVVVVGLILIAVFLLMAAINLPLAVLAVTVLPANIWIVMRIRRRLWAICLLVMSFAVIWVWEPPVAASVAAVIPILALMTVAQMRPAGRAYAAQREALGDVVTRLQEDFAGRHVIGAAGAEEASRETFVRLAYRLRTTRKRAQTIGNTYIELMTLVGGLAGAALASTAANRVVVDGTLSVGGMVALSLFLTAALAPIPLLSAVLQRYLAARASFRTLSEPFAAPVRPEERVAVRPCDDATGEVVLTGVSFAYPGTPRQVLHEVDLTIPSGATVAVVGATGAGKSSIAKLVGRVYDPDAGSVTVGGTDIRDWDLSSYRRRIGIVPQDGFCFRGTVAENIAYGRPDAERSAIEAAAKAVGALDAVLGLVGGLDARVEEEGRNLTAAQVQLIALARAWLTQPDLLILDEATSSLDPETEQHVLKATRALDCTTIMITHRLPVAQSADTVVVVGDGTIVESGSPSALKRRKAGAYSALWAAGPEVEARVAGALEDPNLVEEAPVAVPLPAAGEEDPPIVRQVLEDLRNGVLGVNLHTLDEGDAPAGSAATAALAGKMIGETDEELETFLVGAGGIEAMAHSVLDALRSAVDPGQVGDITVAFEVTDGDGHHRWVLGSEIDAAAATLERGDGPALLTMRISGTDLLRLALGQLDPIEGVMGGRIVMAGDLEQITRLGQIFAAGPALVG